MGKALVTTLQESVNDVSLFKENELVYKVVTKENTWIYLTFTLSTSCDLKVENGYFADINNQTSKGTVTSFIAGENVTSCFIPANTTAFLKFSNKKALTDLGLFRIQDYSNTDFITSTSPSTVISSYSGTNRYASNIKIIFIETSLFNEYNLEDICVNKTLDRVKITGENVLKGKINNFFKGIKKGIPIQLILKNQLDIFGDSSDLKEVTFGIMNFVNNTFDINLDDIDSESSIDNNIQQHKGKITGSPLNLKDKVIYISFTGSTAVSEMSNDIIRPRNYILGGEYFKFKTVAITDNFLISQASKEVSPDVASAPSWVKHIIISGTRSSVSDAAVATLAAKGYTVTMV